MKKTFMLISAILLLPVLALFADEMIRLDANVSPTFQSVELNLDAQKTDYSGTVNITVSVKTETNTFFFHAEEMTLDKVSLQNDDARFNVQTEIGAEGTVTATTDKMVPAGEYQLTIDFHKDYNTQAVGLYRVTQNDVGYLFTQFEALDARKAFPCWDEPSFKIPFQFTIHTPESEVAVTNTPVVSETVSEGIRTYKYKKSKPMSTYFLAVAAGPLESVEITGLSVPGRIYTTKGQSHLTDYAIETTPPILDAIEQYFGSSYPYEKLDLIAIPEYWPGAMENAGAVTYKDEILLVDSKTSSVSQKRRLVYVTAHELAHMWFGDLVTMKWWDDLWLNESFADWMAEKISHPLYPEFKIDIDELQALQRVFATDARTATRPIRREVLRSKDISEDLGLAYGKGKKVLGMVEKWIGEEDFRKGVINYLEANAWGNAEAADLWGALAEASGKDVKAPLASFLEQPGYPMIHIKPETGGKLHFTQTRFVNSGVEAEQQTWAVPIRLKYSDGQTIETKTVVIKDETAVIDLGKDIKWVLPDAGGYGYYRWSLPESMLLPLANNPQGAFSELEQVAYLGNATALLDAGIMTGDTYLSILSGFAKSTEPDIVATVASKLTKLRNAFIPDDLQNEFAYYIRTTFRPALDHFGMEMQEGEAASVSLLRQQLIAWLGDEGGDAEVRAYAASLAEAYMKDPASVDPSLVRTVLQINAIDGDRALFDTYKANFESAESPAQRTNYLVALGAFHDEELQEAAFTYILEGPLRPNELFTIPRGMPAMESNRERYFNWMLSNYKEITSRLPKEYAAFMPYIARGCSEARLAEAKAFFEKPENQVSGTLSNLAKISESVMDCVNLQKREGAAVTAYLVQLAGEKPKSEDTRGSE